MRSQLNIHEYIENPLTEDEVEHFKKCDQQAFWCAALISMFAVLTVTYVTYKLGYALSPEDGSFNTIKAAVLGLFVATAMFFVGHTSIWRLLSRESQWPRFQITEIPLNTMSWIYGGDYIDSATLSEGHAQSQLDDVQILLNNVKQKRGYVIKLDIDVIEHLHGEAISQYARSLKTNKASS